VKHGFFRTFKQQEYAQYDRLLAHCFGYYLVLMGESDKNAVSGSPVNHCFVVQQNHDNDVDGVVALHHALPFGVNSTDVAVLSHVMENTARPSELLEELDVILQEDGAVLVSGFVPVRPQATALRKAHLAGRQKHGHRMRSSVMKKMLKEHGYDIIHVRYYGGDGGMLESCLPWLQPAYAILAKKSMRRIRPLKERGWKFSLLPAQKSVYGVEKNLKVERKQHD
jgi:ubiquinone/menaquinone biosynthesis C-methylase UbiE